MDETQYTIGKVSCITGVKPYILRYWEKEFPFLQPLKNKAGHRIYSERDLFIVKKIKELVYERGFSIAGAKKILWQTLLGKRKNSIRFIDEIREDLYVMLEHINASLR